MKNKAPETSDPTRRSDIVALAQQMFLLQVGRYGGTWLCIESQREVYKNMSRECLNAAEVFITESRTGYP